jgi:hypothetical protein
MNEEKPNIADADRRTRVRAACECLAKIFGLTNGSLEIHCHAGQPKAVDVHDKSFKLADREGDDRRRVPRR